MISSSYSHEQKQLHQQFQQYLSTNSPIPIASSSSLHQLPDSPTLSPTSSTQYANSIQVSEVDIDSKAMCVSLSPQKSNESVATIVTSQIPALATLTTSQKVSLHSLQNYSISNPSCSQESSPIPALTQEQFPQQHSQALFTPEEEEDINLDEGFFLLPSPPPPSLVLPYEELEEIDSSTQLYFPITTGKQGTSSTPSDENQLKQSLSQLSNSEDAIKIPEFMLYPHEQLTLMQPYYFSEVNSSYALISLQGNRSQMQDTHSVMWSYWSNMKFVGVFDGHGTDRIACYLRDYLFFEICRHPEFYLDIESAIRSTFKSLDSLFMESEMFARSGCVCVCAIFVNEKLYIVNLGDCRAALCNSLGECKQLSIDHTPVACETDLKRIQDNNGVCLFRNGKHLRVGGELNVTRAFGDSSYKKFITAEPDVHIYDIRELLAQNETQLNQEQQQNQETDQKQRHQPFLVLASDGLWDDFNQKNAAEICCQGFSCFPERAIESIYAEKECFRDNTTVIAVNLAEYLQSLPSDSISRTS